MKVAVLFDSFGPYHLARLRAAAAEVDLLAIECFRRSGDYAWARPASPEGFATVTLFPGHARPRPPAREMATRLSSALAPFAADVVAVPGWSSRAAFSALRWCLAGGVATVAMSESTAADKRRNPWTASLKQRIARLYSAALVGGAPQARYAVDLGLPEASVFTGYDAVDNGYFAGAVEKRRRADRPPHLPCRPFFLAASRFIPEKNLPRLIEAYALYRQTSNEDGWDLVLLGDGPLREKIDAACRRLGLAGALHMPGFLQYDRLPDYYAWAGAFIHASTSEPWGLVVNEAMASGLPVIVSNACGCCEDLVEDGGNGFTFDPRDVRGLAALMGRMASDACDRAAMGEASRRIVGKWGPKAFATGMKRAAAHAMDAPRPKATLIDHAMLRALGAI